MSASLRFFHLSTLTFKATPLDLADASYTTLSFVVAYLFLLLHDAVCTGPCQLLPHKASLQFRLCLFATVPLLLGHIPSKLRDLGADV